VASGGRGRIPAEKKKKKKARKIIVKEGKALGVHEKRKALKGPLDPTTTPVKM